MMKELGTGILNWQRGERITDRYGTVCLRDDADKVIHFHLPMGQSGKLLARLVEKRESYHIGDIARGLAPGKGGIEPGEVFLLGEGTLFVEQWEEPGDEYCGVGVKPADGRETDWLNPDILYKLHSSKVTLLWDAA